MKALDFQRRLWLGTEHPNPQHFDLNKLTLCYRVVLVQLFQHPNSFKQQVLWPWDTGKREKGGTSWEIAKEAGSQWKRTQRFQGATPPEHPCNVSRSASFSLLKVLFPMRKPLQNFPLQHFLRGKQRHFLTWYLACSIIISLDTRSSWGPPKVILRYFSCNQWKSNIVHRSLSWKDQSTDH